MTAASLTQTGHMLMLSAIIIAVLPGASPSSMLVGGIALIGWVCYAVEVFGGVYDIGRGLAREDSA